MTGGTATGNAIQAAVLPSTTPNGAAGGDLGSTYPNPTVTATHLSAALPIAQGGTGQATDPLAPWLASDGALLVEYCDPSAASSTSLTTAGTVYLMRLNIRAALTATNIVVAVTSAGNNTGGSTGTFVGLYSSAGSLLSGSADVAGSLTATGAKTLALTTPQALSAGTFVWAAILTNLGTTQPTLARTAAGSQVMNGLLAAASFRMAVNGTTVTALPSPSITPGSNTATGALGFWVGIS